ncbi:MAG: 2-C-methyl-D-erythritol 4-phosphate cytidylyltransferase [Nitrospirae bacterium]|nr:2-C-methyl-D-erythritol 4-phosphate cytidylyltransferase [Nitrospirota bacterium]MCL5421426.1 2-C-methyl-D-erythritol 4-phosphate cytidylyltransferase [Nitrospirota bacterium]
MKESIVAIVPAAGLGTRFSPGANKPFHALLGKPLIVWSLELLETLHEIKEIIPVLKESDLEMGVEVFERYNLSKVKRIAPGGKERQDSVYNGLKLVKGRADMVLIHDGARPLVDSAMVKTALNALSGFDGVIAGVPVKDTIKEVQDSLVKRTLKRETLWAIQTPQLFLYDSLMKAYDAAMEENFYSTDDAALLERNGGKVRVIMGSYSNIKVTTPEDIPVAEQLLRERMKPKE